MKRWQDRRKKRPHFFQRKENRLGAWCRWGSHPSSPAPPWPPTSTFTTSPTSLIFTKQHCFKNFWNFRVLISSVFFVNSWLSIDETDADCYWYCFFTFNFVTLFESRENCCWSLLHFVSYHIRCIGLLIMFHFSNNDSVWYYYFKLVIPFQFSNTRNKISFSNWF